MKQLLTSCLLLSVIFSCTKNDNTQFDLTIIETGTNIPVSEAKIIVSGDRFTRDISFPIIRSVLDTLYTDNDGFAEFSNDENYDVIDFVISKEDYFSIVLTDSEPQLEHGENKSYQFEMAGFAYLKFLLIDSDEIDEP